jgi:pteridine reductase
MTKAVALAAAPRVSVNAIALGAILPPANQEVNENILTPVPAKRWANLQELEETMLFLLNGPAYITGEIIHLDGGRHLV